MRSLNDVRKQASHRIDTRDDRGIIGFMVSIMIVPLLMGCAALGIDVANWYYEAQRMQTAADAASLAGVIYMPGDFAKASAAAIAVAAQNGYSAALGDTITPAPGAQASQLRVTIRAGVHNMYGGMIGSPQNQGFVRTAVADYVGPAPMGSPCNLMGNEKMESGATGYPQYGSTNCDSGDGSFWLEVAGKNLNKVQGDAFQSNWCTVAQVGSVIDGCDSIGTNPIGTNSQYDPNGYIYTVRVSGLSDGQTVGMQLQGYDMSYAPVGLNCESMDDTNATAALNAYVTTSAEAALRYKGPPTNGNDTTWKPYCAGDVRFTGTQGDGTVLNTTVTLRQPSVDALKPLTGQVICTRTFGGYGTGTNGTKTSSSSWAYRLNSTSSTYSDLQETFHRWTPLNRIGTSGIANGCNSNGVIQVQNGDYTIQVNNGNTGGGENMYSLRARFCASSVITTACDSTGATNNTKVSLFAISKEALYNNIAQNGSTTTFHLVRLDTRDAGHALVLSFFDVGDSTGGTFTINVMQPDNSNMAGQQNTRFSPCTFSGVYNNTTANQTCQIANATSSSYGGRWQNIYVQVPSNYVCNATTDQSKCWVRIQMVNNTSNAHDTTTWTAGISGVPVRLIE